MEIYKKVEGNAYKTSDARNPSIVTATTKDKNSHRLVQIEDQGDIEAEENHLMMRALKQISRNGTK